MSIQCVCHLVSLSGVHLVDCLKQTGGLRSAEHVDLRQIRLRGLIRSESLCGATRGPCIDCEIHVAGLRS